MQSFRRSAELWTINFRAFESYRVIVKFEQAPWADCLMPTSKLNQAEIAFELISRLSSARHICWRSTDRFDKPSIRRIIKWFTERSAIQVAEQTYFSSTDCQGGKPALACFCMQKVVCATHIPRSPPASINPCHATCCRTSTAVITLAWTACRSDEGGATDDFHKRRRADHYTTATRAPYAVPKLPSSGVIQYGGCGSESGNCNTCGVSWP